VILERDAAAELHLTPSRATKAAAATLRTARGSGAVVMTFRSLAVPYFYYIADQVDIVPKAIWSKVRNPVSYWDARPIGTGPFTVRSCSPENIVYKASARYWRRGLPRVKTINYSAFLTNDTANSFLAMG